MVDATIAQVRVLIPDVELVFGASGDETMFSDDEITSFIEVGHGNAMWAAGLAMVAVGNSEALIEKVITTQDLSTDGSKLQAQWVNAGVRYIGLGKAEVADADFDFFQIIDYPGWGTYHHELAEN
jgi:hypothetical protein